MKKSDLIEILASFGIPVMRNRVKRSDLHRVLADKDAFDPKHVKAIDWKAKNLKVSGVKQIWEAEISTNRNTFKAEIREWKSDTDRDIKYRDFYTHGHPFDYAIWMNYHGSMGGGDQVARIDAHGNSNHGVPGSGQVDSLEEAKAQVEKQLLILDKKYFYKKNILYPYG